MRGYTACGLWREQAVLVSYKFLPGIVLLALLMAGCNYNFKSPMPPWQKWAERGPPGWEDGTKEYNQLYVEGWVDGCHTGIAMSTTPFYRQFYKFEQDAYKAQDVIYYKGWKDAIDYCNRVVYQHKRRQFL